MSERKEWVSVRHSAGSGTSSRTTATVTLQEGALTVKWSVATYPTQLKRGVEQARAQAVKALDELREVLS